VNRDLLAIELRARRLRANLTQAQLARRMTTSQSLIARVEAAAVSPGVDVIDRWAHATGIPLTLTFGAETLCPTPPSARTLLREQAATGEPLVGIAMQRMHPRVRAAARQALARIRKQELPEPQDSDHIG
jgi:transcriptional regulator with XRE-family HTH domain